MSHTPGPWKYDGDQQWKYDGDYIWENETDLVATIPYGPHYAQRAHLIAAAPELLEALELVLPVAEISYDGYSWYFDGEGSDYRERGVLNAQQRFEKARAAIAKAKGEEER